MGFPKNKRKKKKGPIQINYSETKWNHIKEIIEEQIQREIDPEEQA